MDINTTPLIDVMLVLLVMLIITIPIQLHAVNLDLPVGTVHTGLEPDAIRIEIDGDSAVFWQGSPLDPAEMEQKMERLALMNPQPVVNISPDKKASYAVFAKVLSASKRSGLTRIAVTGSEQFLP